MAWEPSTTAGSSREKYGKTMEKKEKVLAAADPGCGRVPVNKIIPFSAVDGPGNRTAVFLQGCNFDCRYCHNPETRNLCRNCGSCVGKCPKGALFTDEDGKVRFCPEKCCGCDTCIHVCPFGCSPRIRMMCAEEVFAEVKKQQPYIRGITVSGGECTLYPDFLEKLFVLARGAGLGTLIDSNGTLDFEKYPQLLAVTDGVMLDIKSWDLEDHLRVTGAANERVLKNLEYLAASGRLFEVRTVVVPELFDCEKTVRETARLAASYLERGNIRYKIIAYRPMGVREAYSHYHVPDQAFLDHLAELARLEGMTDVLVV